MVNHKRTTEISEQKILEPLLRRLQFHCIYTDSRLDWFRDNLEGVEHDFILNHPSLSPWLVQACGTDRYLLIDGYQRQRIVKKNGNYSKRLIECCILPETLSYREILEIRLKNLTAERRVMLTGLKTCEIVNIFQETGLTVHELSKNIMPWFGEKPSIKRTQQILQLASFFEEFNTSETLENLKINELIPLLRLSKTDIPNILNLTKTMRIGGNKWKILLQLLDENSRIREVKVKTLLEDPELKNLINHPFLQGPVRYRLIKQLLERWRFPELNRLRDKFESAIKDLKLPQNCNLEGDPYFEEEKLTLKIQTGSVKELSETITKFNLKDSTRHWEVLFKLLQN